eukprot:9481473-Pyramimonas_sp.AAC.1
MGSSVWMLSAEARRDSDPHACTDYAAVPWILTLSQPWVPSPVRCSKQPIKGFLGRMTAVSDPGRPVDDTDK